MWRRALAAAAVVVACAVVAAVAGSQSDGKTSHRHPYPLGFVAGPGKTIAERWCVLCHSATLVTQQAKDSTAWEKTIGQMERWGVKLSAAEHDSLRAYLAAHYGARAR